MEQNKKIYKNNIFKEFKLGIETATKSFKTILKNKHLLLYFAIPLIIFAAIEIISYNMQKFSIQNCSTCLVQELPENILFMVKKLSILSGWLKYFIIAIIYFIHVAIITIVKMAITYNTNHIQRGMTQKFIYAAKEFSHKIRTGLTWTAFIFMPILIFQAIGSITEMSHSKSTSIFYILTAIIVYTAWTVTTAFVIQSITLENVNILEAFDKSINKIKSCFFKYLGAMFWIAITGGVCSLPFIFLDSIFSNHAYAKSFYVALYGHFAILCLMFISCVITTAYEVAKTLLYTNDK